MLNSVDHEGVTPLMLSVQKENLFMARFLVAKGAALDPADAKGDNVFHFAALKTKEVVEVSTHSNRKLRNWPFHGLPQFISKSEQHLFLSSTEYTTFEGFLPEINEHPREQARNIRTSSPLHP